VQDSPHTHNNNVYIRAEEFQLIAEYGFSNGGISLSEIIYINKPGWFCNSCKQGFIDLKLAYEMTNKY
jgi:hypothetical protein